MPYADIASLYVDLPLRDRLYARVRYATAPLEKVAALVPQDDAYAYAENRGPFDAVAVVDMLYLLPASRQDELIRLAASRLRPGGCLIIKEMTDRPVWKRRWCYLQEWLAVRVFGLTKGAGIFLRSGGDYRVAMERAGLAVETFDLTRGYPHPHFALRGRKATYG